MAVAGARILGGTLLRTFGPEAQPYYTAQPCVCRTGRDCVLARLLWIGTGDGMADDLPGYRRRKIGAGNCHLQSLGGCARPWPGYHSSTALVYCLGHGVDRTINALFALAVLFWLILIGYIGGRLV